MGGLQALAPGSVTVSAKAGNVSARAVVDIAVPAADTGEANVPVRVQIPAGVSLTVADLRFSAGVHEAGNTAAGAVSANVPTRSAALIVASTRAGKPLLLSVSAGAVAEIDLDLQSTAVALVFLTPGIATSDPDSAAQTLQQIRSAEGVSALVGVLKQRLVQNPETDLLAVDSALVQAVRHVGESVTARKTALSSARHRALSPTGSTSKSGVQARLLTGNAPKVELTNARGRWVSVAVSSSTDGRTFSAEPNLAVFGYLPLYRLEPAEFRLSQTVKSHTITVPLPENKPYVRVTSLGPGLPPETLFRSEFRTLAVFPTVATATFNLALPVVEIVLGVRGISSLPIWGGEGAAGLVWINESIECLTSEWPDWIARSEELLFKQDWGGFGIAVSLCAVKTLGNADILVPLVKAILPRLAETYILWAILPLKLATSIYSITTAGATLAMGVAAITSSNSVDVFDFGDRTLLPVAGVIVAPSDARMIEGEVRTFSATPVDAFGDPLDGRAVTWSSTNPVVASVSPSGSVAALGVGTTTITATVEGRSGASTVTVAAPAATAQLQSLTRSSGQPVDVTNVTEAFDVRFAVLPNGTSVDSVGLVLRRESGTAIAAGIRRFTPALSAISTQSLAVDPAQYCPNGIVRLQMTVWYRAGGRSLEAVNVFSPEVPLNFNAVRCNPAAVGLTLTPATLAVPAGGSATTAVSLSRSNFTGSVSLAVPTTLPAGLTATVTQQPGTGNAGSVRFALGTSYANFSNLPVTIRASGTGIADATQTVVLSVSTTGSLSMALAPSAIAVAAGGSATTSATITRANFTGNVTLSVPTTLPAGLSATVTQQPGSGSNGAVRFSLAPSFANFSNLPVIVRATGVGVASVDQTIVLNVAGGGLGVGFASDQFVEIAGGTFQMGSTTGLADQLPIRSVTLSTFKIQKSEVTQSQWRQVMAGQPNANPSFFAACGDACPVERVSWSDIQSFLSRLNQQDPGKNYRLPTESEWEYAARAGSTGDYGGNGILNDMGWWSGNSQSKTWPVGQKRANAWGLYDMHGNVWEWVADWYGTYASGAQANPAGPSSGTYRVNRGGSCDDPATSARSAFRNYSLPTLNSDRCLGFRIVYGGGPVGIFTNDQFVNIPSGSFQMGQSGIATPVRTVTISRALQMQRTEVTQGQWRAVMGTNPSFFSSCGDTCPVENVSWLDVQSFLTQLNQREPGRGYRLPTEAEWEYAARAGTSSDFSSGASICTFAWISDCGVNRPSPVAQKAANPWGLYDMHGNVWEWVSDWYGTYPSTNQTDPTGPTSGTMRVARGGSFGRSASEARSAFRQPDVPGGRLTYSGIPQGGFRLVRNP
jgi:formylglycine-generating enzyme required for sulfatase activity